MEKWEYKYYYYRGDYRKNIEQNLNELGQQGWELVCVQGGSFYFKRRLPQ